MSLSNKLCVCRYNYSYPTFPEGLATSSRSAVLPNCIRSGWHHLARHQLIRLRYERLILGPGGLEAQEVIWKIDIEGWKMMFDPCQFCGLTKCDPGYQAKSFSPMSRATIKPVNARGKGWVQRGTCNPSCIGISWRKWACVYSYESVSWLQLQWLFFAIIIIMYIYIIYVYM